MSGASPNKDRSVVVVLAVFALCIVAGPLVFYGLVSLGDAGVFDNPLDNFWVIVGTGLIVIVAWWAAILFVGSRITRSTSEEEQTDG